MSKSELDIVLVGCGGFAVEVADYIIESGISGFPQIDVKPKYILSDDFKRYKDICKIFGSNPKCISDISEIENIETLKFVIGLGDPLKRFNIAQEIKSAGGSLTSVIHRSAHISKSVQIGKGSIVAPFCVLSPFSKLGINCVLNTKSTIGHDSQIGNHVVISPHSVINGGVMCGDVTLVSAGCVVDPGTQIGKYCKLASGAILKQNIPDGSLVVGNPAKGRQMFKVPG